MTALQNNIDPKKHLNLLFTKFGMSDMPKNDAKGYLPWADQIKNSCCIKNQPQNWGKLCGNLKNAAQ